MFLKNPFFLVLAQPCSFHASLLLLMFRYSEIFSLNESPGERDFKAWISLLLPSVSNMKIPIRNSVKQSLISGL